MNPEQLPKAINTLTGISSTSGKSTITLATSHSSGGQPNPTTNSNNSSGNNSGNKTNVGAIVGGTPRNLEFRMIAQSNPPYPTGVVGSVVPLSILGFGVFFFMRSRQQKQLGRSQFQNQELDPPYKLHPPSMYGAPVTPVTAAPFTPYVSLSCGTEPGNPSLPPFFLESFRPVDVPSSESSQLGDIHHSVPQPSWNLFWHSGGVITVHIAVRVLQIPFLYFLPSFTETNTTSRPSLIIPDPLRNPLYILPSNTKDCAMCIHSIPSLARWLFRRCR